MPSRRDGLDTYRAKRQVPTPEPIPATRARVKQRGAPRFVIQEHHARALHWDFRLERDGVLKSWAVPKGLPPDHSTKRLAVQTEDHPLEYLDFAGEIPKGAYGGGDVAITDRGTYELERWDDREIKIVLHGTTIDGRFVLIHTKDKQWLVKRLDADPQGVTAMPDAITPMLARLGDLPEDDNGWAYEFKWDGIRALAFVDGGRVMLQSRSGQNITASFPSLSEVAIALGPRRAILDGEIVAFDENGRPSFGALQQRAKVAGSRRSRTDHETPISYLVFDVLYLDGLSLLERPYDERRLLLDSLHLAGSHVGVPPQAGSSGEQARLTSLDQGLEGVVAKRRDSAYVPGARNGTWIKVKNVRTQDVLVIGFTAGTGRRAKQLGALVCGVHDEDGGLVYVGRVGTGFSDQVLEDLSKTLASITTDEPDFAKPITRAERSGVTWVKPVIVGEVEFLEWTTAGRLRAPTWRGVRLDIDADSVQREPD